MSVTLLIDYWLIAITALFVVVNPLTTAFIFVSLLPNANAIQRRRAAKRSTLVSAGIFLLFGLLGSFIFKVFGITLEAFRIAGGLILFGIAMSMMQKGLDDGEEATGKEPHPDGKLAKDVSIIPLAIPFIAGPGAIATVMILTSEAQSLWHFITVFLAIGITTFSCYLAMIYSHVLVRYIGETGKEIITRLFGLILSVIAVQFVINGVLDIYRGL